MAKGNKKDRGLYRKNIVMGRNPDGSYIRKNIYGKTKKELELKITEITQQLQNGIAVWENGITFAELSEIWIEQYNPMATERWKYLHHGIINKHLLPSLGSFKVKDIRQLHLQTIISNLAKKDYASRTMKEIKQTAVRIMRVAVESDLILRNPFSGVLIPSKEANERKPLTPAQIKLVTENWRGHRMGCGAMIMLYAGLRKGELLALQWEDIDLEKRVIRVNKSMSTLKNKSTIKPPKTKAGTRDVPIPNLLLPVLIECSRPSGSVCLNASKLPMNEMGFKRGWDSYMSYLNECAGGRRGTCKQIPTIWVLDRFTAHMLRHTYATMLFDANVDVKSAQKFLGHADIEVTLSIYTHLTKYKEDKAIGALNEHLDNLAGRSFEEPVSES